MEKAIDEIEVERKKFQEQARTEMLTMLEWAKIKLHSTGLDRFGVADYESKIRVLKQELEKEFEEVK